MRLENYESDIEWIKENETKEIIEDKAELKNIEENEINSSIVRMAYIKLKKPEIFNKEFLVEIERLKGLRIYVSQEKMIEDISLLAHKLKDILPMMDQDEIDRIIDNKIEKMEIEEIKKTKEIDSVNQQRIDFILENKESINLENITREQLEKMEEYALERLVNIVEMMSGKEMIIQDDTKKPNSL